MMMKQALNLAKQTAGEIPVGAIIVKDGHIIAQASNTRESENDITSHAEISAIKRASNFLGTWHLDGCELYVTLEPCPMCAWAILQSRISTVYFGSYNPKYGAFSSAINLALISDYKPKIYGGIMEKECDEVLSDFWAKKRSNQHQ
ncbi:nucleoside deaminase [bacterium]|nr:nucleoside deaminase [bacterium]